MHGFGFYYQDTFGEYFKIVEDTPTSEPDTPVSPAHYKQGIEVYDFIESHNMNFAQGNVVKYVSRYQLKNGVEDLWKAQWYLNKLIEMEEKKK